MKKKIAKFTLFLMMFTFFSFNINGNYVFAQTIQSKDLKINIDKKILKKGESYSIKWEVPENIFKIELKLISGGSSGTIIFSEKINDKIGIFQFKIPLNLLDGKYRIKIKGFTNEYEDIQKQLSLASTSGDIQQMIQLQKRLEENVTDNFSNYFAILEKELKMINSGTIYKIIRNKSYNIPSGKEPFGVKYVWKKLPKDLKNNNVLYFTYSDDVASSVNKKCQIKRDLVNKNYFCYIPWGSNLREYNNKNNYFIFKI